MASMDRFEGCCWLDWWANPSIDLGGIAVSVVITPTRTGWDAHAQLINPDDRQGLTILHDLDPVFTLRFQDGSTIQVTLTDDDHRFTLAEYPGPARQQADSPHRTVNAGPVQLP